MRSEKGLDNISPMELNWLRRQPQPDEEESLIKNDENHHTVICDQFWDEFIIIAKAVYIRNKEADIYDVLNFIRERFLGGWTLMENSTFIREIDADIEREFQKELKVKGR